ncbi:MAG: gliding motility-associated C-terminal domain-containing protein, partial [Chitinophagales bacterium]
NGDELSCVVVPDNTSCSTSPVSSNIINVRINYPPSVNISPADTIIKTGAQVQLNGITAGNVNSFQWTPANMLQNPSSLTPVTVPLSANTTYTLSVVSDKGCVASKNVIIKIFVPLYMPSAFTPNHDGKNDIFRIPLNVSLLLNEFSIYDRWGHKIFSTQDIGSGWDGTINGQPASTGVYVYIIKGANDKGKVFLKGSFTLIK